MRLALLLYKYFPYGGMQRDFLAITRALLARGHECRIYCLEWQGESLPGIELHLVKAAAGTSARRGERFLRSVSEALRQQPVDGIVGFNKMPGLDVYFAADPCFIDRARTQRGWLYRRGGRFRHFAAFEQAVFGAQSETRILLISDSERRKFELYYHTPARRMYLLPPGVSSDRRAGDGAARQRSAMRQKLGLASEELTLLLLGSGFATKGLDRALRALAKLQRVQPDQPCRLLVVGQDRQRRFQRLARRLGVVGQVSFLGGRDDVPGLLLAADLLIHPARAEAGGIVLLEALAAGLPVLATDVCGYAHHVAAAAAGTVLASPFRQEDLNQAVLRSVDGVYRAQCRQNALIYAEDTDLYSMHETAARLIEQIVTEKRECDHG